MIDSKDLTHQRDLIYKSSYSEHSFDFNTQILYSTWFKETDNMSSKDFKNEMREWLNVFRKVKPKYLLDDCINFLYPIISTEQIWMANLLNAEWIELGLKKYAHMVPKEYVAECSVEQLFDEFFKMKLNNQYPIMNFSSTKEALDWLYK